MRRAVVVSFVLLLVSASAMASPLPSYDLVDPRVCLAGEWGRSTRYEWRIQLGLFNHERAADRRARVVARRGLATESYIAAWLARDDREPIVVVSRSFKSRRAALRAIRRYRAAVPRAFARRYERWVQSEARRGFEHGSRHASLLPELCGCAVLGGVPGAADVRREGLRVVLLVRRPDVALHFRDWRRLRGRLQARERLADRRTAAGLDILTA
jgi:hypothetical protein